MFELTGDEIKEKLFDLLSSFADYCEANNLSYFLCGGTLLGAVRHHDFIPWDDDVDLVMPRPDFMKLIELEERVPIASNVGIEGYEKGDHSFPFIKIVDRNIIIEKELSTDQPYLWIDVFPVDGMPDNIDECNDILDKAHRLKQLMGFAIAKAGRGQTKLKAIGKLPLLIVPKLIGAKRISERLHQLAIRYDYNTCSNVAAVSWSCGRCELFEKEEYMKPEIMVFHGKEFKVPSCWDSYLKAMYGNYMELPPEGKRATHVMKVFANEL